MTELEMLMEKPEARQMLICTMRLRFWLIAGCSGSRNRTRPQTC